MSQVTSSEVKPLSGDDVEAIDRLQQAYRQLVDELGKVIVFHAQQFPGNNHMTGRRNRKEFGNAFNNGYDNSF